jgi:lysozyme
MKEELVNEIRDHIKEYEGFSALVYECTAGYATIGYGRNLEQRGITKEEAEHLLANDIKQCIKELKGIMNKFDDLPEKAQLVLIDMCYNLGLSKLLNFENMLDAIDARDWEKASSELLDSRYAAQVKRRARINAAYLLSCADAS